MHNSVLLMFVSIDTNILRKFTAFRWRKDKAINYAVEMVLNEFW